MNFKYVSDEGSKRAIFIRISKTTVALSRLKLNIFRQEHSLASMGKLVRMLIVSTTLYDCESWTLKSKAQCLY